MTPLSLRRRPRDPPTTPEAYCVLSDGVAVGTVVADGVALDCPAWHWSITALPRRSGATMSGRAWTREEAAQAFRAAWQAADVDLGAWRAHMADVDRAKLAWERSRGMGPG